MSSLQEIQAAADKLPPAEKLHLMETLWDGLRQQESDMAPLEWHRDALTETERNLAEGREEVLEWDRVKEELRDRTV